MHPLAAPDVNELYVCYRGYCGQHFLTSRLTGLSSRAEEFHLRALPKPCVNLSIHTAPDVRPFERLCLFHGLLPFPVGPRPRLNNAAPLLPSSLLRAAPSLCSASVLSSSRFFAFSSAGRRRIEAHKIDKVQVPAFVQSRVWSI